MNVLPTWCLKKCTDPLLQLITAIINRSLTEGVMQFSLKCAAVTPLLREARVDEDMSSYGYNITYKLMFFMIDIIRHIAKITQQR